MLILVDNIFYGKDLSGRLKKYTQLKKGGLIFGYRVRDPERYGVVDFDNSGNVTGIEEKPENPKTSYAVPGLYFYDNDVVRIAENLKPSSRGELEITDINLEYLCRGHLKVELFGRGVAWLDTGTHESLEQASSYIRAVQERQGLRIACIEEIAFRLKLIDRQQLRKCAKDMAKNDYGKYLMDIADEMEIK